MEHEGEIADETVIAVFPHIPSAKAHAAALHIPEPRHKIAERGLAAAGRADDGDSRFLRNGQGYIVQNGLAVIGKVYMAKLNVLPLRRQLLSFNVHGFYAQNRICFVHTDVDGTEQSRKAPGRIQLLKENEGADEHQKAIRQLHGAAEIEYDGSGADGNAGELVDDELRQHIEHRREFHGKRRPARFLHSAVYLRMRSLHITHSFSRAHVPYDNSVMESFFSSMKREELYRAKYRSESDFRKAADKYIIFYNTKRPHRKLQYKTPEQKEEEYALKDTGL